MQSCLGIYIENNLIKYAKVSRDRDNLKVDSFGTKFYENVEEAIQQVVQETNSTKSPIAVNSPDARYDYFNYFALLNKNALKKSIDIDFEMLCTERGIDKDSVEKRYIFELNPNDSEQLKAINASINKINLNSEKELLKNYNLTSIMPMPIGITNLVKLDETKNELIVNLEELTTLTFTEKGHIDSVESIPTSILEAIEEIARRENSKTKAYEILKNITITTQDYDVMQDGNEYMDVVIPVLFKIVNEIKEKINEFGKPVHKIHFSGTGIIINNIDMYFQDRLNDIESVIIKPPFLDSQSLKIGIKDYIEVNSAIALALTGLNIGKVNDMDFGNRSNFGISGIDVSGISSGGNIKSLKETSGEKLDAVERLFIRMTTVCLLFIICYAIITNRLYSNMSDKDFKTQAKIDETNRSIEAMTKTEETIENLNDRYEASIARFNNEAIKIGDSVFTSTEIQNFLSNLKTIIPRETKLVSLENTKDRHFVIQARANKYQQLGYLKALLETPTQSGIVQKPILENVKASTGTKYYDEEADENFILITIEGDLPE